MCYFIQLICKFWLCNIHEAQCNTRFCPGASTCRLLLHLLPGNWIIECTLFSQFFTWFIIAMHRCGCPGRAPCPPVFHLILNSNCTGVGAWGDWIKCTQKECTWFSSPGPLFFTWLWIALHRCGRPGSWIKCTRGVHFIQSPRAPVFHLILNSTRGDWIKCTHANSFTMK